MSLASDIKLRSAVRKREERYFANWEKFAALGHRLKPGSKEKQLNKRRRIYYKARYLAARKRRRALDRKIELAPVTQVDTAGENFIIGNEGVVLHPYNDSRGFATVGVGHLLHQSPVTSGDRAKYSHFDKHDAMALLARDLDSYEAAVAESFHHPHALKATQGRFNALVSFCFNIGTGGYRSSSAAAAVRVGNKQGVINGLRKWKTPPEIGARREREVSYFARS